MTAAISPAANNAGVTTRSAEPRQSSRPWLKRVIEQAWLAWPASACRETCSCELAANKPSNQTVRAHSKATPRRAREIGRRVASVTAGKTGKDSQHSARVVKQADEAGKPAARGGLNGPPEYRCFGLSKSCGPSACIPVQFSCPVAGARGDQKGLACA